MLEINKMMPERSVMYNAWLNKDSSFEGIFFVGVKTTGIFCRPTCTAKKPKEENIEFFSSAKDALSFGTGLVKFVILLRKKAKRRNGLNH